MVSSPEDYHLCVHLCVCHSVQYWLDPCPYCLKVNDTIAGLLTSIYHYCSPPFKVGVDEDQKTWKSRMGGIVESPLILSNYERLHDASHQLKWLWPYQGQEIYMALHGYFVNIVAEFGQPLSTANIVTTQSLTCNRGSGRDMGLSLGAILTSQATRRVAADPGRNSSLDHQVPAKATSPDHGTVRRAALLPTFSTKPGHQPCRRVCSQVPKNNNGQTQTIQVIIYICDYYGMTISKSVGLPQKRHDGRQIWEWKNCHKPQTWQRRWRVSRAWVGGYDLSYHDGTLRWICNNVISLMLIDPLNDIIQPASAHC